jgi:hypothetical protein
MRHVGHRCRCWVACRLLERLVGAPRQFSSDPTHELRNTKRQHQPRFGLWQYGEAWTCGELLRKLAWDDYARSSFELLTHFGDGRMGYMGTLKNDVPYLVGRPAIGRRAWAEGDKAQLLALADPPSM